MKRIISALIITVGVSSALGQSVEKVWVTPPEFDTPESAIYHDEHEIIYVSNIGPEKGVKNGDGFVSLINWDGKTEIERWVTGLNDPKGMGISGKNIYIADMNEVVVINFESGKIEEYLPVPKTNFLNDVTVSDDGKIFVSDIYYGRIYIIGKHQITLWKSDPLLQGINGLDNYGDKLYVGNNSIWEIDIRTGEMKELVSNTQSIYGLICLNKDTFIYSNWEGKIFLYKNGKTTLLLDTSGTNHNAADISYSKYTDLLLVPTFLGNTVDAYRINWEDPISYQNAP